MKCMQILFLFVMLPFNKHGEQKYIAPVSSIPENMGMLIYRARGNTINETVVRGQKTVVALTLICSMQQCDPAPPFYISL